MPQPITAAAEITPRGGLGGAVGFGVIIPESDPLDPDGRWLGPGGYSLEGEACPNPEGQTASADFCAEPRSWGAGRPFRRVVADQHPFLIEVDVDCSTFGSPMPGTLEAFEQAARRALDLSRWSLIAYELWTGERSQAEGWDNLRLASPDAQIVTDGEASVVEAIAALEDAFGVCSAGDRQLIHVPRKLVPYLDAAGIIEYTPGAGSIYTANGSLIIADRGYPGTGPAGQDPTAGQAWIYSTGVLSARLGDVRVPERDLGDAIAATTNDVSVRALQPVAIGWLCCQLAANVRYC